MKLVGLSRPIAFTMMAIALGMALLIITTSYIFYYLWDKYWPNHVSDMESLPSGPELIWIVGTTLVGLFIAVLVAVNLSRRILVPLNSVTSGIRRLAQGDLTARAATDDRSLGEATQLADDFNVLASKLQRMTEEQIFWNAAIAHELRTPVTILRGRLQGLAEGVFPPEEALFRNLLLQVEGLNRLIEDLRVVSLAESGHLDMTLQQVNLAAEIQSVVDLMSESLSNAGQYPVLDIQVQYAQCDPARIRQCLLALLENVKKYAVPGSVWIQARIDNGSYRLSVSDEGPGIPANFIPYVFTAFRRAPEPSNSGSGLGLAVVAAIAQAHGGKATCAASSQGGTVFEICWPTQNIIRNKQPESKLNHI